MGLKLTNTSDPPDDDLVKEVYAHFGLCIYLSQVFETGMINILTALETAVSKSPTRQTFDQLYGKHESLTFGNLLKALKVHDFLPADLLKEVRQLKAERDYLAHRFFRDHDLDFMTVAGCYVMIEFLESRRDRFISVDERVSQFQVQALAKIGIDPERFDAMTDHELSKMLEMARSRYSSKLAKDQE